MTFRFFLERALEPGELHLDRLVVGFFAGWLASFATVSVCLLPAALYFFGISGQLLSVFALGVGAILLATLGGLLACSVAAMPIIAILRSANMLSAASMLILGLALPSLIVLVVSISSDPKDHLLTSVLGMSPLANFAGAAAGLTVWLVSRGKSEAREF